MDSPCISSWPYTIAEDNRVVVATYNGVPLGKQRPRFSRGRVYTPNQTKVYEGNLQALFVEQLGTISPDGERKFGLRCLFFRPNRQRIDCDNLIKAVSDAATGIVWKDDSQVLEIIGRLYVACESPRTEILIHLIEDLSPRESCKQCGKQIIVYPSVGTKFCSKKCWVANKRTLLKCDGCGSQYLVPNNQARKKKQLYHRSFCTRQCAVAFYERKHTPKRGRKIWPCVTCGNPVSRPEYKRCFSCRIQLHGNGGKLWAS